jgi:hypothetical protein
MLASSIILTGLLSISGIIQQHFEDSLLAIIRLVHHDCVHLLACFEPGLDIDIRDQTEEETDWHKMATWTCWSSCHRKDLGYTKVSCLSPVQAMV